MKSVLITGAYSPLGHAIADKFFKENYLVYGTSTREREDECFKTICVEIRDEKAVKEKLKDIDSLDVLVNNAGIFTVNAPEALTLDDFDSVFDVNVKGMMLVTKYLLPVLKKSNGSIVNISSMNSLHPGFGGTSHYDASKGAVSAYTRSLARESGLRVNALAPGLIKRKDLIKSDLAKHYDSHSIAGMLDVKQLADSVFFLANSSGIYGQTLLQDNGYCIY